jgi:hypothetical protein
MNDLYLILMNPDLSGNELYKGAVCIYDDRPYYVTSISPPTIFKTEKEAVKIKDRFQKQFPNVEFYVITIDCYLSFVEENFEKSQNSWVNQLKQEQLEMGL